MEKLQLALLTQWAEDAGLQGIHGRKRLQKALYFLQQAGCPIDTEYTLHHYGPYSREVANLTDVMVAERLLIESVSHGGQYDYSLSAHTRDMIRQTSPTKSIQSFETYLERALELLRNDLEILELGSTILYCYRSSRTGPDWDAALHEACEFKREEPADPTSQAALALAQQFAPAAA